VLGHTIEEQAQIELNERGVWEPKLTVDGTTGRELLVSSQAERRGDRASRTSDSGGCTVDLLLTRREH
jgi:hypothetical protein